MDWERGVRGKASIFLERPFNTKKEYK